MNPKTKFYGTFALISTDPVGIAQAMCVMGCVLYVVRFFFVFIIMPKQFLQGKRLSVARLIVKKIILIYCLK